MGLSQSSLLEHLTASLYGLKCHFPTKVPLILSAMSIRTNPKINPEATLISPSCSDSVQGLIFCVGLESGIIKLYDIRNFDQGPFATFMVSYRSFFSIHTTAFHWCVILLGCNWYIFLLGCNCVKMCIKFFKYALLLPWRLHTMACRLIHC